MQRTGELPVDLIIPARDEAETIGPVLDELPRAKLRRVIVVDNGSRDGTGTIAREYGAEVLRCDAPGYGNASLAALATMPIEPSVVLWMVADGSDDPSDLDAVVGPVVRGEVDLCIGTRVRIEPGAMTPTQRYGSAFAAAVLSARFGLWTTDLGPFRAIRREALEALSMRDRTWGWTIEMQVKALREQLAIREVPVAWRQRRGGQPKVAGTVRGTLGASRKILSWMAGAVLGPRFDPTP
ncbi:MAG: glycosyltransferase family 2 protein [Myxococcales bacterium]|nr:glycosyltransferase family 2 protein [Myxococcales bacterium]